MIDQTSRPAPGQSSIEILSQHQLKHRVGRRAMLTLIISLSVMFAAIIWSVYRWYFAFSHFGPAVVWRWSGPAIGLALSSLLLAVYAGLFLIRNRQRAIYTTPEGLWMINGSNRRRLKWTEFAAIQSSSARYPWNRSDHDPQLRIELTTIGGETISIPSFLTALDEAQQIIKSNIYPLVMDRYRELMKSGQPLDFGPIQLTRSGVTHSKQVEPWQHFQQVSLRSGRLLIDFQTDAGVKQISVRSQRVPNIDLCVQLLRNIEY